MEYMIENTVLENWKRENFLSKSLWFYYYFFYQPEKFTSVWLTNNPLQIKA